MVASRTARDLLGQDIPKDVVAVLHDGKIYDLHSPLPEAATTENTTTVTAGSPEGLRVIRHSTAHVMADAVQRLFPGTKVTIGPAIDDGFYYDFDKPGGAFTEDDLTSIEKKMLEIIKEKSRFRREVVSREQALERFKAMDETFKLEIIEAIPEGEEISLYFHGRPDTTTWVDVCEGPHVPHTGMLKAMKLTSVAGAYWRGDEKRPMLQRIYGTAFDTPEALAEHLKRIEEAKARDHRKLGKELELFHFDEIAPAMPFFLPKGAFIYNALHSYIRELYDKYDYQEVVTPQAFDPKLFRTSGHLGAYNENMYRLWTEDQITDAEMGERELFDDDPITGQPFYETLRQNSFGLKPMNCPSHCVLFGARRRSYRELPWRVADFGRLHRYERGGVVHGLSRVRTFCQDDGHIFCAREDVATEISKFIALLNEVYETFGFTDVAVKLATRPEKRIGSDADWDLAEDQLAQGLRSAGLDYEVLPGEGAFYGPKIEFHVQDALKRSWQLGTIQFDPNLPERFELEYVGKDGAMHRPIMLHRAILGSLERFFSVYLEHCGGNFPTWIAPRQAVVLTVSEKADDYAHEVTQLLKAKGLRVDLDVSSDKIGAKIRNARMARYPYRCVVGVNEAEARTLGVASRDRGELGAIGIDAFADMLLEESRTRRARS